MSGVPGGVDSPSTIDSPAAETQSAKRIALGVCVVAYNSSATIEECVMAVLNDPNVARVVVVGESDPLLQPLEPEADLLLRRSAWVYR